ncbi:MAG TPA: DNA metabolism protein [Bacteroidales bacterium]|nr:MAG: hypothetical protein A2X01_07335 [Bacteroidetes bacterium GWF2_35_48]OFZ02465.1 MAG: hypothetical protein A2491_06905 [Bacteroidetes bacterium RIFOXYC12_FULL_35_7]HBX50056.1 DNA metabolism protein [Bacteroidales bacterium]
MTTFIYDNTFEGLLTAVFDSYVMKARPAQILPQNEIQSQLWANPLYISTDEKKAERVWNGLEKRLSKNSMQMPYRAFLSEMRVEMLIYNFIRLAFDTPYNIEENYFNEHVLEMKKLSRKVSREACRNLEFVRFQKTKDNIYYASVSPEYNILPMILKHFEERYPDQQWIIYDIRRKYGFLYDLQTTKQINLELDNVNLSNGQINSDAMSANEDTFRQMWKDYFNTMAIPERKNLKLQMNLMPKRFWKYLTEKID